VSVVRPGGERMHQALSCKLVAEDGLEVTELAAELMWNLRHLLTPGAPASPGPAPEGAPGLPPETPVNDEPPPSAA
jgi:hypothetical protein